MNAIRERSVSLWQARHDLKNAASLAALTQDAETDVLVVGGGIAGLSTAYELARAGKRVVVVDRGRMIGGMTSRTTAHLASALDDYYHVFIRQHGRDQARLYYRSQKDAIDRVESIALQEGIGCNFVRLDGILLSAGDDGDALIQREIEACREIGIADAGAESAGATGLQQPRSLAFRRQARFDPVAYCRGLIAALQGAGAQLYENTVAAHVEEENDGVTVAMENGSAVRARHAVFATNSPANDKVAIHSKQAPYRTYVIAARAAKGAVPDQLLWDTLDPYHYVRLEPEADFDWVIVGGEDHKTGAANDAGERFARLEDWARGLWPALGKVEHRWSGQVMEPVDDAPFIGRNPGDSRVFVITGDSGQGMTNGVAGSLVVRDLIVTGKSVYEDLFDPSRKPAGSALEYMQENMTAVKSLASRIFGPDRADPEALAAGEGAVIRQHGNNVAAARSADGTLTLRSAVCSHLGCLVQWNGFEQCWDCPCHGSHFAITGEAINAPAVKPLKPVEKDEPAPG